MQRILILLLSLAAAWAADPAFAFVIRTDNPGISASDQYTLPLYPDTAYDVTVDWGDGQSGSLATTHTYARPGTYVVRITENRPGGFPGACFGQDAAKLTAVTNWGDARWQRMDQAFQGCVNLVTTAPGPVRTGQVTSFNAAWFGCERLTGLPILDTSAGTDFHAAWYGCSSLTGFPVIDTAKGTDFSFAWAYCSGLTGFPRLDTAAGTDFAEAWRCCQGLEAFPCIDTAKGMDFSFAWFACERLRSFPRLDTANGRTFRYAWANCTRLPAFPRLDTAKGTDFSGAWYFCSGLTCFPALATAQGTDFSYTWFQCTALTSFPVPDLRRMTDGSGCFGLVTLPTATYSDLLISLASRNRNPGVVFDGGNSRFAPPAAAARDTLITGQGWMISDGGPGPAEASPPSGGGNGGGGGAACGTGAAGCLLAMLGLHGGRRRRRERGSV